MLLYSEYENGKNKKIKVLGLTIYKSRLLPPKKGIAFYEKKYIKGLFKTKESAQIKKYYILGIKIGQKEKLSFQLDTANNKLKPFILGSISNILNERLAVSNLHSKVFPQFKNKHKDQTCCIIGTGPTLKKYKEIKNTINIGCNRAFQYEKVKLDYLFAVDWYGIKSYIEEADNYDCIKFYGSFLDAVNIDYLQNPQYILDKATYNFYCRLQSSQAYKDLSVSPLVNSGSIALCAINFALYTHPKKIYLVGLDTNKSGNFDNKKQTGAPMDINLVMKGYRQIKKLAYIYYPDVEIISVNPVGLRGLFSDYYQDPNPIKLPFDYKFSDLTNTDISISGLSHVEQDFRWSEKDEVNIDFKLENKINTKITFELGTWLQLLKHIGELDVDIYVNGNYCINLQYTEEQPLNECSFIIDNSMLGDENKVNIKFKFKNTASPSMYKLNSDYRMLGLKFIGMNIQEV